TRRLAMQVYIAKEGRQEGPYPIEYINSEVAAGRIKPTDLAWIQGWAGWQPVSGVPGFVAYSPPPSPSGVLPAPMSPSVPLPQGAPMPPQPSEQESLLRTFVGKNYEYYSRKWAEAEQKPNKNSWNWAAFFLSPWWTAYRKMYRYAWIPLAVVVVFGLPGGVATAISVAIAVTYGLQGNRWYRTHAEQKIKQITSTGGSDETMRLRVAKEGGTSAGAVIAFVGAFLVLLFAVGFVSALGKMH